MGIETENQNQKEAERSTVVTFLYLQYDSAMSLNWEPPLIMILEKREKELDEYPAKAIIADLVDLAFEEDAHYRIATSLHSESQDIDQALELGQQITEQLRSATNPGTDIHLERLSLQAAKLLTNIFNNVYKQLPKGMRQEYTKLMEDSLREDKHVIFQAEKGLVGVNHSEVEHLVQWMTAV